MNFFNRFRFDRIVATSLSPPLFGPPCMYSDPSEYCDERICVDLSVRELISKTERQIFTSFGARYLWQYVVHFRLYMGDIVFAYVMARNRRREEAYTRSQSAGGSTHSMLRRILRLTYERQHRTGGGICCLRLISPAGRATAANFVTAVVYSGRRTDGRKPDRCIVCCFVPLRLKDGSIAEWLACWTQAQKGPGSNRSRDAVG